VAFGSLIVTNQGLKYAEDIQIGDRLLASNRKWTTVTAVREIESVNPQYLVKPRHGLSSQVSASHPFLVNEFGQASTFAKLSHTEREFIRITCRPIWKNADELQVNDILLFPKIFWRHRSSLDKDWGRILGCFLGDGSKAFEGHRKKNGKRSLVFKLHLGQDKLLTNKYQKLLKSKGIHSWIDSTSLRNRNQFVLKFRTTRMGLSPLFLRCYKNNNKHISPTFLEQNNEFRCGLIEGLTDSDGHHPTQNQKQSSFTSASLNLLNGMYLLLASQSILPSIRYRDNPGLGEKIGELSWRNNSSKSEVFEYKQFLGTRLRSIEKVSKKKKLINIETAHKTFCLPYCITHNSEWRTVDNATFPPGTVGASKELFGYMYILDKGKIEIGAMKPTFNEYYVWGTEKWKGKRIMWGRFVIRALPNVWRKKSLATGEPVKTGKGYLVHMGWFPDEEPYTLSSRAIKKGWVPPVGISALPKYIRKQIPEEFQYWKKKTKEATRKMRDALFDAMKKEDVKISYEIESD